MPEESEDMHYRFERKFVFENKQAAYVESLVKNHPANFHEIFRKRFVNNIYFDKPDFDYYFNNFEGNSQRMKVRIRWYGGAFGWIREPILELKIKEGELGIKKSFLLPEFILKSGFNAQNIRQLIHNADLPENIQEQMKGLQPQLVNSYCRSYYRSFNHHFRFTVDSQLDYFPFMQNHNLFLHKMADFNKVILELKYNQEYSSEANRITMHLPIRLSKFSKYVAGMEKLYLRGLQR
jgi:SPX domain protein involved in polyphosphate accumulation